MEVLLASLILKQGQGCSGATIGIQHNAPVTFPNMHPLSMFYTPNIRPNPEVMKPKAEPASLTRDKRCNWLIGPKDRGACKGSKD